ncbi:energy transducer TonB [Occallatibacter savannae]|uniref:energy transducer TonB n=1 Tax=Occallatibacter savannae TaxID=1002691 RepID=UPI000D69E102|nr:energy transducer TonB [Occallatibacter savannae]
MFEDSTFESTGKIKTRSRRWMMATLALNGTILAILVLMPLIYPDALPRHILTILLVAPDAPKQLPPEPIADRRIATPNREFVDGRITAPPTIPTIIRMIDTPERPLQSDFAANFSPGEPGADGKSPFGEGQHVTVIHPVSASIHLSSRLVEGNLIYKSVPQYPVIAKATHTEGTIVLQAMISKTGTIEGLHVISGPQMLQQAAIDAVKTWRYKPYMLNGQAVEVETTVNVIFKLQ